MVFSTCNVGFLTGEHLVTRLPCGNLRDICKLKAVDTFLHSPPSYAYENLIVLCTDASQACSPASCMSGGGHDGDDGIVIGWKPLVHAFSNEASEPRLRSQKPVIEFNVQRLNDSDV